MQIAVPAQNMKLVIMLFQFAHALPLMFSQQRFPSNGTKKWFPQKRFSKNGFTKTISQKLFPKSAIFGQAFGEKDVT